MRARYGRRCGEAKRVGERGHTLKSWSWQATSTSFRSKWNTPCHASQRLRPCHASQRLRDERMGRRESLKTEYLPLLSLIEKQREGQSRRKSKHGMRCSSGCTGQDHVRFVVAVPVTVTSETTTKPVWKEKKKHSCPVCSCVLAHTGRKGQ